MNPRKFIPITKANNPTKRLATFLVLEPQDSDGTTTDLHGDWYDESAVEDACLSFNRFCMKGNLLHEVQVDKSAYEFVESYISKCDMILGDTFIKKGSWLATCYFPGELWDKVVDGTFNGLSIQCLADTSAI